MFALIWGKQQRVTEERAFGLSLSSRSFRCLKSMLDSRVWASTRRLYSQQRLRENAAPHIPMKTDRSRRGRVTLRKRHRERRRLTAHGEGGTLRSHDDTGKQVHANDYEGDGREASRPTFEREDDGKSYSPEGLKILYKRVHGMPPPLPHCPGKNHSKDGKIRTCSRCCHIKLFDPP